jgi:hypothetical protein
MLWWRLEELYAATHRVEHVLGPSTLSVSILSPELSTLLNPVEDIHEELGLDKLRIEVYSS